MRRRSSILFKFALFIFLAVIFPRVVLSQSNKGSISGKLTDSTGEQPLALATISVFKTSDTNLVTYRLSNPEGIFKVPNLPLYDSLTMLITYSGSMPYRQTFVLSAETPELNFDTICLIPDSRTLEEVLVIAERPPVIVRNDTIEFNAEAFKTLPSALVEDLLKKLPGVDVDAAGNIMVNGRRVNKLYVDGKEFFGSDPQMATKNLPANIIDKIQVTDDKEQMLQNPDLPIGQIGQVINLKLKKAIKQGWFGKAYAGQGTDNRNELGGIFNLFRDTLQVSLLGYTNNLNKPGFGMSDVMSTGGFNRSGYNSMMVTSSGGFALNDISFGGTGSGIQRSTGAGININNQLKENLTLNFQYFYGEIKSDINSLTNRQQFFDDTVMVTRNQNTALNTTFNHRFGGYLKWKIDSTSNFEFRPTLTLKKDRNNGLLDYTTSDNFAGLLNDSKNLQQDNNNGVEYKQVINYSKNFRKKERRLYAGFNFSVASNDNNRENNAENNFFGGPQDIQTLLNQLRKRDIDNTNASLYLSYNEPISKKITLELTNSFSYFHNKDNVSSFHDAFGNHVFDVPDPNLSDSFRRSGFKNSAGMSLRFTVKKLRISPGISYQAMHIDNDFQKLPSIPQRFNYLLPMLRVTAGGWSFSYNASANEPSASYLQPVQDNTNPLYIQNGNPSLKPSVSHNFNIYSYKYLMNSGLSYNVSIFGGFINNSVIMARTVDPSGVQTTTPVNANGSWSSQSIISINKSIKFSDDWKFSAGGTFVITYSRNKIMLNDKESTANNWWTRPRINVSFDWQDLVELRQDYTIQRNRSTYSDQIFPDLKTTSHQSSTELVVRLPKHFVWETSIDYQHNPLVASGIRQDIVRWNAALNFLFLKEDRGQLRLSVFDLLNQNTSVYRSISQNYIQDVQTTVLRRYLMLTFTYNFRKFGGKVGGKERLLLF